ncbi:MAG: GNAT family N-acetyltransferase [Acidimicrobiales bacterium]
MTDPAIRLATRADAEAIRTIYNREVQESTVTFDLVPRTLEEQRRWLAERDGALGVLVAELDGRVVGFASLSPWRAKPAYSTSVENSVYVHEAARGLGVGSRLLEEIVDLAVARGFHTVLARIVDDHEASIALHRSVGFEVVGTEKEIGRKFGRWLDVVVMQRMLT